MHGQQVMQIFVDYMVHTRNHAHGSNVLDADLHLSYCMYMQEVIVPYVAEKNTFHSCLTVYGNKFFFFNYYVEVMHAYKMTSPTHASTKY
jgi:hypothetical protein